ncbi:MULTISPECIES: type IV pilin N-terminal domain-containing protein [unclassified Methanoculleus]|jgi:FlaG/FlaF family flagellin (archaellin)|uniref:type IV pilin N-terminal domain-containing protein n=1 Tax=unclassified Methanoculleus TaxID=2619537 RepID=UPI0025F4A05D|nr:type IV pilin N-terminal domain-containing protein [Methanoculleus sp. UBA377]
MNSKNEDAVSPVIGVMLMIVVTVVIAAIVSAFAGDITSGSDRKTVPVASIAAEIVKTSDNEAVLTMKHLSGDPIDTRNLRIIISYIDSTGTPHQKRLSGDVASISHGYPYLTDAKAKDNEVKFGTFVWMPGQIISTDNPSTGSSGFAAVTGITPDANFKKGTTINIRLVDSNTQKAIFDQDVIVR